MSRRLDVAIIGASDAGLAFGSALAGLGYQVMIFDGERCVGAAAEQLVRRHALAMALDEPVCLIRRAGEGLELETAYATYRAGIVVLAPLRGGAPSCTGEDRWQNAAFTTIQHAAKDPGIIEG